MKNFLSIVLIALTSLTLVGCDDPRHLEADIDLWRYEEAMALKADLVENRHLYPREEIIKVEERIEGLLKNNEYW